MVDFLCSAYIFSKIGYTILLNPFKPGFLSFVQKNKNNCLWNRILSYLFSRLKQFPTFFKSFAHE